MTTTWDSLTLRRATAADATALSELGAATFTEAFGHLYRPEDLAEFLALNHSPDNWTRTLGDTQRAVFVAEHVSGRKAGFICVGACKLPVQNREATAGEIQQLYVRAEYQNFRLGSRLMDAGLGWLTEQGRSPLYIGVWSQNLGAQRFYGRYGFNKIGEYGFPVGKQVDREFILKR
jgi:ribosomal protein S18 acetylase RimI-like enzyme